MSKTLRAGKHAFTLVELLVVIGVIALLISMLLPALQKARQSAVRVQCASNIRQIGISMFAYAADNKGWFPLYYGTDFVSMGGGDRNHPIWKGSGVAWMGRKKEYSGGQLSPYVKNYNIFFDPAFHQDITIAGYLNRTFEGTENDSPFTEYVFFNGNNPDQTNYDPKLYAGKVSSKPGTVICVDRNLFIGSTWQLQGGVNAYGMNYMAHKEGFNVMYADGHVSFFPVSKNNVTGIKSTGTNYYYPGGNGRVAYDRN